jgi:hypothetical protein
MYKRKMHILRYETFQFTVALTKRSAYEGQCMANQALYL